MLGLGSLPRDRSTAVPTGALHCWHPYRPGCGCCWSAQDEGARLKETGCCMQFATVSAAAMTAIQRSSDHAAEHSVRTKGIQLEQQADPLPLPCIPEFCSDSLSARSTQSNGPWAAERRSLRCCNDQQPVHPRSSDRPEETVPLICCPSLLQTRGVHRCCPTDNFSCVQPW